jgi:hypothetical protein
MYRSSNHGFWAASTNIATLTCGLASPLPSSWGVPHARRSRRRRNSRARRESFAQVRPHTLGRLDVRDGLRLHDGFPERAVRGTLSSLRRALSQHAPSVDPAPREAGERGRAFHRRAAAEGIEHRLDLGIIEVGRTANAGGRCRALPSAVDLLLGDGHPDDDSWLRRLVHTADQGSALSPSSVCPRLPRIRRVHVKVSLQSARGRPAVARTRSRARLGNTKLRPVGELVPGFHLPRENRTGNKFGRRERSPRGN